jgi:prepilin-type N-terminal cleavage/methylation domain-containing protein
MKNIYKQFISPSSGFTLIEIIVATTVFVIASVMFMGIFSTISNVTMRVEGQRFAMQDARYAIEQASREIRDGWNFRFDDPSNKQKLTYDNADGTYVMEYITTGTGNNVQGELVRYPQGAVDTTGEKLTSTISDVQSFAFDIIQPPGDYPIIEIRMTLNRQDFEKFKEPIELSTRVTSRTRDKG